MAAGKAGPASSTLPVNRRVYQYPLGEIGSLERCEEGRLREIAASVSGSVYLQPRAGLGQWNKTCFSLVLNEHEVLLDNI
ncbi:hypothetical protein SAMN05428979_3739 [Stappia sp. ES.058]|nr:hypothetical protein SAMN05428979_3739 [Stappia sp. ES.058]